MSCSAPAARRLSSATASIETIEHCMSAFAGLRIDNALVRIDGPELPMRRWLGCAVRRADTRGRIDRAGCTEAHLYAIREPIVVEEGDAMLAAFPSKIRWLPRDL
jgi:UDP-3-O-acyl-N-acetylglucosamine deacetylase